MTTPLAAEKLSSLSEQSSAADVLSAREEVLKSIDEHLSAVAERIRALVPQSCDALMHNHIFINSEFLTRAWNANRNGYSVTGKLRDDIFEECGFENKEDASRKLRSLQRAIRDHVSLTFYWNEDGPYFQLQWDIPGAKKEAK